MCAITPGGVSPSSDSPARTRFRISVDDTSGVAADSSTIRGVSGALSVSDDTSVMRERSAGRCAADRQARYRAATRQNEQSRARRGSGAMRRCRRRHPRPARRTARPAQSPVRASVPGYPTCTTVHPCRARHRTPEGRYDQPPQAQPWRTGGRATPAVGGVARVIDGISCTRRATSLARDGVPSRSPLDRIHCSPKFQGVGHSFWWSPGAAGAFRFASSARSLRNVLHRPRSICTPTGDQIFERTASTFGLSFGKVLSAR